MILGGVTLPAGTKIDVQLKDIGKRSRTAGGTLKRDIITQKHYITVKFPMLTGTTWDSIKMLIQAQANVDFTYTDDDGASTTKTVAISSKKWKRKKEYGDGTMLIEGASLSLEEV